MTTAPGFHRGPARYPGSGTVRTSRRIQGRRFGVASAATDLLWAEHFPRLSAAVCTGPVRSSQGVFPYKVAGAGVAIDPESARLAAVVETVERYASTTPPLGSHLTRSTYAMLTEKAIRPSTFATLSSRQCRQLLDYNTVDDDTLMDWCWAYSLTKRCTVLIPAAFAHFVLPRTSPASFSPEPPISGTACHVSMVPAILAGLCEVIERDALMIAWMNRLRLRRIEPTHTYLATLLHSAFSQTDIEVSLFDLPTDSPYPVVMAIGRRTHGSPHAVVGAACRKDYASAALKAICEITQMIHRYHGPVPQPPTTIRTLDDHSDYYASANGAALLREVVGAEDSFLLMDVPLPTILSAEAELDQLVAALCMRGLEVLVVDTTPQDVAAAGFCSVRVVVPGAADINIDDRFARLACDRLFQLPVSLGIMAQPLTEEELNPLPVPLA